MEYKGAGIIPLEAPVEELKDFFKRKLLTWARSFTFNKDGKFYRQDFVDDIEQAVPSVPEERREEFRKTMMEVWEYCLLGGRPVDSIKEKELIDIWMYERVFTDPQTRRKHMEKMKEVFLIYFVYMDTNHDGTVDYDEFRTGTKMFTEEAQRLIFEAFDVNKDALISKEEYTFGVTYFFFTSGPDSPLSLLFGPLLELES